MPIHTPYNFAPLSRGIAKVNDPDRVSHDIPFRDALSGSLEIELTTVTPLCIGGARREEGDRTVTMPFEFGGRYAIPGSSLKGMLRNVLEIASFSRMAFVDHDRRFAFRDLSGPMRDAYQARMTEKGKDSKGFRAKAKAGWLRQSSNPEKGPYEIVPCDMVRVLLREADVETRGQGARPIESLEQLAGGRAPDFVRRLQSKDAPERYQEWLAAGLSLEIDFKGDKTEPQGNVIKNRMARALRRPEGPQDPRVADRGVLVFTGSPSDKKKREFVFYNPQEKSALPITKEMYEDFCINHSDVSGERHGGQASKPDKTRAYLQKNYPLRDEMGIPVFYLEKDGGRAVEAFGLASMFRLVYKHSVGDLVANAHPTHLPQHAGRDLDLAEAIFGVVRTDSTEKETMARKGRAWFGMFFGPSAQAGRVYEGILNQPKPTFVASYIEQQAHEEKGVLYGDPKKSQYTTYEDSRARLRGWKRYPVRSQHDTSTERPVPAEFAKVASRWRAVRPKESFHGHLRFHNLRPFELGALLWCLDFGGRRTHAHSLGYAKPFGFGAVRLQVRAAEIEDVSGRDLGTSGEWTTLANGYIEAFKTWMIAEGKIEEWESREPIRQLISMADPTEGDRHMKREGGRHPLTYMQLENFRIAKQNERAVLVPYDAVKARKKDDDYYPQWSAKAGPALLAEERQRRQEARKAQMSDAERFQEEFRDLIGESGSKATDNQLQWIRDKTQKPVPTSFRDKEDSFKAQVREFLAPAFQELYAKESTEALQETIAQDEARLSETRADPSSRRDKAVLKRMTKAENRIAENKKALEKRLPKQAKLKELFDWWGWSPDSESAKP